MSYIESISIKGAFQDLFCFNQQQVKMLLETIVDFHIALIFYTTLSGAIRQYFRNFDNNQSRY